MAAGYLGLSTTELRERLRRGQSLAQVARAQGRSPSGLIAALVAFKARRLATALAEHVITKGEERTALASLRSRVTASVEEHLAAASG